MIVFTRGVAHGSWYGRLRGHAQRCEKGIMPYEGLWVDLVMTTLGVQGLHQYG